MDDFKIIFWIIIGLIYLFSRRKKAEPKPTPTPRRPQPLQEEERSGPPPKSFEELLKEIQGMKEQPRPQPERRPEPVQEFVDYDDDLGDETRDLEDVSGDYGKKEDRTNQLYEEAKAMAFARPSLEETVKLEDTIVRFKQFKGYEKDVRATPAQDFLKELRTPQGFRKAFIMSEILRRKF